LEAKGTLAQRSHPESKEDYSASIIESDIKNAKFSNKAEDKFNELKANLGETQNLEKTILMKNDPEKNFETGLRKTLKEEFLLLQEASFCGQDGFCGECKARDGQRSKCQKRLSLYLQPNPTRTSSCCSCQPQPSL